MSQSASVSLDCFLLTRQWRDGRGGLELTFWGTSESGPVRVQLVDERAVCFVDGDVSIESTQIERRCLDLRSLEGVAVDGLYFRHQRDLVDARDRLKATGVRLYESDLKPSERYLMERFITGAFTVRGEPVRRDGFIEFRNPSLKRSDYRAALRAISLDIETEGLSGALYSIAVHAPNEARVFLLSEAPVVSEAFPIDCFADEKSLLSGFFDWVQRQDPDLILGWNVVSFDLEFLENKCQAVGIALDLGRGGERATILRPQGPGGTHVARIPGRVVLDGIDTLRAAFWSFESFELETVAQSLLGRGKTIAKNTDKVAEISRLFKEDKRRLVEYNLEDCRLVTEIFAATRLVDFAVRRSELTGLGMDRFGGAVAAFDNLYLPRLHRRGRVARDRDDVMQGPGSPGGYVMDSKPGLYDNVLLLDFKSLYPSIIRTFKVDPYGMFEPGDDPIPGYLEATFARDGAILPELIEELWRAREEAKKHRDAPLSQAVKILMNSFYGVLAAEGCRFYDSRLASSITRRGHDIIQKSQRYLEDQGYPVIYGDTDSLFLLLGSQVEEPQARELGTSLAKALNLWWRERLRDELALESFLEIEFETHYLRFLMPTVRGERTGSKKRYAGLVRAGEDGHDVVFKGLESVRTDWTPLARRFQRELYRRVFMNEPFESYVRGILESLLNGELDHELVYRKRVRRPIDSYQRNVPPHVQAARKLGRPVRWIRYVVTSTGPEPVEDEIPQPDYDHYRERQLAPASDSILGFLDTSFESITNGQLAFF